MSIDPMKQALADAFVSRFKKFREAFVAASRAAESNTSKRISQVQIYDLYPDFDSKAGTDTKNGTIREQRLVQAASAWKTKCTATSPPPCPEKLDENHWNNCWVDPLVVAERNKLANAAEYLLKAIDTAAVPPPPTVNGIASGVGWRQITAQEFEKPDHVATGIEQSYIRGAQMVPWWTAKSSAVQRQDAIDSIKGLLSHAAVIVLHGPTCQGKTTVLRQFAMDWLKHGNVVEIEHETALHNANLLQFLEDSKTDCLCVFDDIPLSGTGQNAKLASLLRRGKLKIIIATQSRFRMGYQRMFPNITSEFSLAAPKENEINSFIDLIHDSGATEQNLDKAEIDRLFRSGFANTSASGLWPAMYQATRGEGLEIRMARLIEDVCAKPERLFALAAVVLANSVRDSATNGGGPPFQRRYINMRLIENIIENLDIKNDLRKQTKAQLFEIFRWFEKEIIGDGLGGHSQDPVLNLRHEEVTSTLFQHIFGLPSSPDVERRLDPWSFVTPFARAIASDNTLESSDKRARSADCISLLYNCDRWLRNKSSANYNLEKFIKFPKIEMDDVINNIADIVLSIEPSDPKDRARALIWKAAISARKGRNYFDEASVYLERCLLIVRDNPYNDINGNIANILQHFKFTVSTAPDGATRDGNYFRIRFV